MTLRCPHCSSKNITHSQTTTAVATCIGALGGIASAVLTATRQAKKSTPITFTPILITSLLLNGLVGGLSGSRLGAQFGSNLSPPYQCNSCHRSFSPAITLK